MAYPFWMMLTGSVSDSLDFRDRRMLPAYLTDRNELFVKFLSRRYSDRDLLQHVYPLEGAIRLGDYRGKLTAPDKTAGSQFLKDWEEFLKTRMDTNHLAIANIATATGAYQKFLLSKFSTPNVREGPPPLEALNQRYRMMFDAFSFIELPPRSVGEKVSITSPVFQDFDVFLRELPPDEVLAVGNDFLRKPLAFGETNDSPERRWQRFLQERYPSDEALAAAWNVSGVTRTPEALPYREVDAALFVGNERELRWKFATENYRRVWQLLSERSDAIRNTLVLIALTLVTTLLVNPLAAYALSRFPGAGGRMALVVILMTIAFPAEVGMIPGFLLLRDLNMLNTYAALVLPAVVSGFSIFLLKGFFDGLPEELYESAALEGADELTVFWKIAMPLSAPILAVTALGTFTATYGGYMWALLVCQAPEMWTIMVWLFQFQLQFSDEPWLAMAAFAIASVPTLFVFVLCQRIILQGIVVPVEK